MINIMGYVYFDPQRTLGIKGGKYGIANVPVVLQNINTQMRLGVYTDNSGKYIFQSVPEGEYRIVEAYGEPAIKSPGKFYDLAEYGEVPKATVPPLDFAPNPPFGATHLDCLTPNTIFVTAGTKNIDAPDILNGPVAYTPVKFASDECIKVLPENLITKLSLGTMGTFVPGTPANSGEDPDIFWDLETDFKVTFPDPSMPVPNDNEFVIQNIMSDSYRNREDKWWRAADRTFGNEQGLMMIIGAGISKPSAVFFTERLEVKPNTNYLFGAWILNMAKVLGLEAPILGVLILGENEEPLYNKTFGQLMPVNLQYPEWKQIGDVINSQSNTKLTIKFYIQDSESQTYKGTAYAIDDITFNEITMPVLEPIKTADKSEVCLKDQVAYTVVIENSCNHALTDVFLTDILPKGLEFVFGSVVINGKEEPAADPNQGFPLADLGSKEKLEVSFLAAAIGIPEQNPALNTAEITYKYTPITDSFTTKSNEAPVLIKDCGTEICFDIEACGKTICKSFDISVPVTITPFAIPEIPKATCIGEPEITQGNKCLDVENNEDENFQFTITQRVEILIPIKFAAQICYSNPCAKNT
jgi:uncharacterized repeat protein (TIGR01451 family)